METNFQVLQGIEPGTLRNQVKDFNHCATMFFKGNQKSESEKLGQKDIKRLQRKISISEIYTTTEANHIDYKKQSCYWPKSWSVRNLLPSFNFWKCSVKRQIHNFLVLLLTSMIEEHVMLSCLQSFSSQCSKFSHNAHFSKLQQI